MSEMRGEESPEATVDIQRHGGVGKLDLRDGNLPDFNMPDGNLFPGMSENGETEMRRESSHPRAAALCGLLVSLFIGVAVWGICPCSGKTLIGFVSHRSHLTFRLAALLVSSAVGILGGCIGLCSLLFTRHNFQHRSNFARPCEDESPIAVLGLSSKRGE